MKAAAPVLIVRNSLKLQGTSEPVILHGVQSSILSLARTLCSGSGLSNCAVVTLSEPPMMEQVAVLKEEWAVLMLRNEVQELYGWTFDAQDARTELRPTSICTPPRLDRAFSQYNTIEMPR